MKVTEEPLELPESVLRAFASLFPPSDPVLDALSIAMEKFPLDDVPALQYLDRLEELGCPERGWMVRMQLVQREMFRAIVSSFGIPARLMKPE